MPVPEAQGGDKIPEPVGTGRTPVPDVMPEAEADPVGGKIPFVLEYFFVWLTEPLG